MLERASAARLPELTGAVGDAALGQIVGGQFDGVTQDQSIERREGQLAQREETIRRRFTALEGQLSGLQQQGNFLAAKMGGGGPQGGQGG